MFQVALGRTKVSQIPFVFCVASFVQHEKEWVQHFTPNKSPDTADSEVVGRSTNAMRYVLVENPYHRLLRAYWSDVRHNHSFETFLRNVIRTSVKERAVRMQPMTHQLRNCVLANPTVLKMELVNQWYGMLAHTLERDNTLPCFYSPCFVPCHKAMQPGAYNECWGGNYSVAERHVTSKELQHAYAAHEVVHLAHAIVQPDLFAFGYAPLRVDTPRSLKKLKAELSRVRSHHR